jgi:hypothetical protein
LAAGWPKKGAFREPGRLSKMRNQEEEWFGSQGCSNCNEVGKKDAFTEEIEPIPFKAIDNAHMIPRSSAIYSLKR